MSQIPNTSAIPSGIPSDTGRFLEYLDRNYPPPEITVKTLSTEVGRLTLSSEQGVRDLITEMKTNYLNQKKAGK